MRDLANALHQLLSVEVRSVTLIGAIGLCRFPWFHGRNPGYIDVEARRGGETCDLDLLETAPCDAGTLCGQPLASSSNRDGFPGVQRVDCLLVGGRWFSCHTIGGAGIHQVQV